MAELSTAKTARLCGGCTLCCRLIPVLEIDKPAGERCRHQITGKGCRVYGSAGYPQSCRLWSCGWLVDAFDDARDLRRPDRCHYVLDTLPDFITVAETGDRIPVIQVWCDPAHRDAHRDPALRAFLARRGEAGSAALVRYSGTDGFVLIPPAMSGTGEFEEKHGRAGPQHRLSDILETLGHDVPADTLAELDEAEAAAWRRRNRQ